MFYYGFSADTKQCQFSADGEVQQMDGMVIVTSEVMYTDIAKLTFTERDGELIVVVKEDTIEDLQSRFERQRQGLLMVAGEQQRVLQDVVDYGNAETAKPLLEAWRKYRAAVWSLTYEQYQTQGWPTKPE